mmetsp:Transcript_5941/g.17862  ORF Transcript_5941/g.17862 Transcript_5941/m.17862 type:complete len:319 (+) Transcript_5941:173-1129(+)
MAPRCKQCQCTSCCEQAKLVHCQLTAAACAQESQATRAAQASWARPHAASCTHSSESAGGSGLFVVVVVLRRRRLGLEVSWWRRRWRRQRRVPVAPPSCGHLQHLQHRLWAPALLSEQGPNRDRQLAPQRGTQHRSSSRTFGRLWPCDLEAVDPIMFTDVNRLGLPTLLRPLLSGADTAQARPATPDRPRVLQLKSGAEAHAHSDGAKPRVGMQRAVSAQRAAGGVRRASRQTGQVEIRRRSVSRAPRRGVVAAAYSAACMPRWHQAKGLSAKLDASQRVLHSQTAARASTAAQTSGSGLIPQTPLPSSRSRPLASSR